MIAALSRVSMARLTRTPRAWLPVVGWLLLGIVGALGSRLSAQTTGADHVLRGQFGFVVLPLVAYGIVSATLAGSGLGAAVDGLVRLGASPPKAALASSLVAMTTSAIVTAFLAAVLCVIAHGDHDPPLVLDVPASFGVAFLGGATYAAYFCAGSAIGRGAMRGGLLAVDWILGSTGGAGALFTPRGHVASLLGGQACFELSRRASSVVLFVLMICYLGLAIRFFRRAR